MNIKYFKYLISY